MNLLIKKCGYAFLIRLDLMFCMSLLKEFQLLQIVNDPSIKYLNKLILYENDVKLLQVNYVMFEVSLIIDILNEYIRKTVVFLTCFSIVKFTLGCLLFKKNLKNLMNLFLVKSSQNVINISLPKFRFVKIIFIWQHKFVKNHEYNSKDRSQKRTHGYSIDLIIKFTL